MIFLFDKDGQSSGLLHEVTQMLARNPFVYVHNFVIIFLLACQELSFHSWEIMWSNHESGKTTGCLNTDLSKVLASFEHLASNDTLANRLILTSTKVHLCF